MRVRSFIKGARLGLYMHLQVAFLVVFGILCLIVSVRGGALFPRCLWALFGLSLLAFAGVCEYYTVYRDLYQKQYLRTTRALKKGWSDRIGRLKMLTPCQRRMLLIAATDAGCRAQAKAFLRQNRLPWRWVKAANLAQQRRLDWDVPFALPYTSTPQLP